jgi:hypothetical protein
LAGDQSLQVAQAECAWFIVGLGEGLGVLNEFFEGHALLADVVFELCAWWSVGQLVLISSVWRGSGVLMAGAGRFADTTLCARLFQLVAEACEQGFRCRAALSTAGAHVTAGNRTPEQFPGFRP